MGLKANKWTIFVDFLFNENAADNYLNFEFLFVNLNNLKVLFKCKDIKIYLKWLLLFQFVMLLRNQYYLTPKSILQAEILFL